jgi:hypothetical protein
MTNLNSGLPWSEIDDRDLRRRFEHSQPIAEIAVFLCRDVDEIEERLRELGLQPRGAVH